MIHQAIALSLNGTITLNTKSHGSLTLSYHNGIYTASLDAGKRGSMSIRLQLTGDPELTAYIAQRSLLTWLRANDVIVPGLKR